MTVYRISPSDVEAFTIVTNPIRHFASSSTSGVTGSIHVFPRRSAIEKDVGTKSAFVDIPHDDADVGTMLVSLRSAARVVRNADSALSSSFLAMIDDYMSAVGRLGASTRKQKTIDIVRFTPTTTFSKDTLRKLLVKDILNKYYRTSYQTAHWAYTNYNSLNFFTSSAVPTGSALLYPNIDGGQATFHETYVSGVYSLSGAFSFDFYINPRYTTTSPHGTFKAGTIFHLSSSYALSLITGSSKDVNGFPVGYQLQLQLSHSADVAPSAAVPGSYPNNLTFRSDDNVLWHNQWHHVVVRWGTNLVNAGTGSFNVDGVDVGTFVIPSGTVAPKLFPLLGLKSDPSVLVVGNYYEGLNELTSSLDRFFAADPAQRDGITELNSMAGVDEPRHYDFTHPLNAEVHDLAIKRYYMSDEDIIASASVGPASLDDHTAFYLPPFFVHDSPLRTFVNAYGGVPQTPFFEIDGTTDDPFNVAMSFGVGGHYINIENFLRDFASNVFPRCHLMTASVISYTTDARTANEFLYDDPLVRRRNLLLLPCDDGNFVPNYQLLESESISRDASSATTPSKYMDDLGTQDLSWIHLDDMIATASQLFGGPMEDGDSVTPIDGFINQLVGFSPEVPGSPPGPAYDQFIKYSNEAIASGTYDPGIQAGAPLTIYQRTKDASSNQVTFFDISNMFYGKRILPGTFIITDPVLTASGDKVGITLKDDGYGNIYRADCETSASAWNSVGNIYYDEGIVVIKSPHLYWFGKHQYEVSFRGEQNVHVMKIDALAPANQLNSSSNPSYQLVSASASLTDTDPLFVYISGVNFHDDNYNVVARAVLAQPILKRHGDRLRIHVKYDF